MMMFRAVVLLLSCVGCAAMAQATPITLSYVLHQVLQEQPSLAMAALNESLQGVNEQQRAALLDGQWGMAINGSDEKKPSPSPFGSNITNLAVLSANISQPLADGSSITSTLSYSRTRLRYPATTSAFFQASLNPVYESKIDVIYRYPLLQGHGNPAYHQQQQINVQGQQAAHWQVAVQQEQLLAQAAAVYFQLAANEISVRIAQDAVHRVAQLLKYQRKREAFGLVEAADRLQTEALLATRQASLVQAKTAVQSSRTALQRILLLPDASVTSWHSDTQADAAWLSPVLRSDSALLADAKRQRPIFRVFRAQIEAADAQDNVLEDQLRPKLNLIGQIGSRALTGLSVRTTNDTFDLRDRYVGVGIEFKDTLGKHGTKAALARNGLQREQVLLQQWQTMEQIRTDIATARTDLSNAQQTYSAMQQRVKAERRKYHAELQRYREGRSDTSTIVQFSGDLRNAELQAALQQITIDLARLRLHLAAGDVLTTLKGES